MYGFVRILILPAAILKIITNLITNTVWVGSSVASANGRKSNINMLDASGNNWETQSSAFTETLKSSIITTSAKFTNASSFGVNKGKISLSRNFEIMGQTSLANATTYKSGTAYNDGAQLNSSYPGLCSGLTVHTIIQFLSRFMLWSCPYNYIFLIKIYQLFQRIKIEFLY